MLSSNAQQEKHTQKCNKRRQETSRAHIKTMCKEMQYIESIFPEYFQESAQSNGDVKGYNFQFAVNPEMEVNNEDGNIVQNIPDHFNINTGLWEYKSLSKHYKSLSKHTPKDMMHPQNVNSTMQRNDFVKSENLDPNRGLYSTYHLKPSILGANGAPMQCNCGSQYSHAPGNAVEKFSSTLYTCTGAVHIKCYNMCCDRGICEIEVFRSSKAEMPVFLKYKNLCRR